jgi:chromosomal replication initiator protein
MSCIYTILALPYPLTLTHKTPDKKNILNTMMKALDTIWGNCLLSIKQQVNQQSYRTWFEPIKPVKLDSNILTIQVPSQFFYEWLEEHYVALLRDTIQNELGPAARLEYQIVLEKASHNHGTTIKLPTNASNMTNTASNAKSDDISRKINFNPFVIPGIKEFDSQLNPIYNFDNYVEGDCNQLARSAGIAVANNPGGTAFNPLVFYGGSGLGKTHLANAIGNHIKATNKEKKVLYLTAERFTNQFIDSVKNGSMGEFSNFYESIDVLIVDDIAFFANKDKTQDIFFHIFNTLHQSSRQIVLTSDCPPRDLKGMEDRLMSRFKWGLSADLQVPDLETRIAILEKKMYADGIEISREVIEYIAYHIKTNVREMEGALISLMAHASLCRKDIDLELAKNTIKNFIMDVSNQVTIDLIHKVVCQYFKIPDESLKGQSRKREIAQARQIAMYLSKKFTENSLKAIGGYFGGRDHSTVIHACQAVLNLMETDRFFQNYVIDIERKISVNS